MIRQRRSKLYGAALRRSASVQEIQIAFPLNFFRQFLIFFLLEEKRIVPSA